MKKRILSLAIVLALVVVLAMPMAVSAAALTVTDLLSISAQSTVANHTIGFTTVAETPVGGTITVTFPTGFVLGSVAFGDVDLSVGGVDKLLAAVPGNETGTAIGCVKAGQVMTFTLNDTDVIDAETPIVIEVGTNASFGGDGSHQITNPSSAASYSITVASASGADSGSAIVIITNVAGTTGVDGSVVASIELTTVPPAIDFGNMVVGKIYTSTESANGKVTCNQDGWTVTAIDQNTGTDAGKMRNGTTALTNLFQIQNAEDVWVSSDSAVGLVKDTEATTAGGTVFDLNVKQLAITYADVAGSYSITMVITAALVVP